MDEDHFRIKVKEKQKMVTFSEMGFKHKSSTKKSKLWSVLLRFAIANNSPIEYYANKSQVEKDIQRLNGVLINYFGINGNPVKYQNDKKGYVTEFKIYDRSHIKEHRNSIATTISDKETLDEEIDKDFHDSSL